ncbi:hypothetical protein KI688_003778 [Linnemannia hyalina]|uniref:P-loop containing nucleoside triphosphate hydrolase protein n=1 Tax=Linnemannia hyalina TaxID=64524 RepID=A0A9P7XN86_9FUNG|nr:hypothetical protein KI688_003778 [Linnemannia hyalina]
MDGWILFKEVIIESVGENESKTPSPYLTLTFYSPAEDISLLLQPKDHSDKDPRSDSYVNHPTNSDITLVLVSLIQAVGFLVLALVRWKFLELGGRHGQPGHIHLPLYRFVMPVAQSIAWSYAFILCMVAGFTRHIVRPSRIRRMLIVFSMFTFMNSLIRTRSAFRYRNYLGTEPEGTTPEMRQRMQAELGLAIINMVLASIFLYVITATSKGPDVYFEGKKVSTEVNASFFRWITYNWMNDIMWEGYERALELEFLPSLTDQMRARPMYRVFARTRSLLWRIYESNSRDIWINVVFGIVSSVASFGMPYFMDKLLSYMEEYHDEKVIIKSPKEMAYLYVIGMLVSDILKSVTFGQNLYYGRRVDVRLRAMLSAEVYSKALRRKDMTGIISESTKKGARSDTGMITNLMAVDANRISSMGSSVFFLYTGPIEIALGVVMLYGLLGPSSLVGLGVMFLTSPAHHFAARKYSKIQESLMETRDRRVGLMSELLQGIRMIKFFAWEKKIQKKIMEVRDQELRRFVRLYIINTFFTLLWFTSPILVTVMSFTSYTKLEHKELSSHVAFTSMAIFFILRAPLNLLPGSITDLLETIVSMKRIEAFLNEGEISKYSDAANVATPESVVQSPTSIVQSFQTSNAIGFTNATFKWHTKASSNTFDNQAPSQGAFMLNNLTLSFPVGKLSLVCGSTGSGKTSLLMALLREMDLISGSVHLPQAKSKIVDPSTGYIHGSVAYVSQYPWLQQASIRENVLFGSPYESERYQHVLEACALLPDLAVFEHGDLTEIGEKGITLSGGQKQRVALARAMYSRAQHLLFDDCLSAVDAHTARHIFENCLKGPLMNGRTRILVTHHVRLCLRDASYVALLKDGSLLLTGSPVKLIRSGLLSEILERNGLMEEDQDVSSSSTLAADHALLSRDASLRSPNSPKAATIKGAKKLVDEEARARGKVKLMVYDMYMKACGGTGFWITLAFILLVLKMLGVMELGWIKIWTDATEEVRKVAKPIARFGIFRWGGLPEDENEEVEDLDFYIGIYCFITLMAVFFTVVRMLWQFYGSLRASRDLYEQLLLSVVRAPIRFFDTTPVGRIINRFSKDFEVIDTQMMSKMVSLATDALGIVTIIVVVTFVTPTFLIAAALITTAYVVIGAYYITASRELKRIESVTKSPLYSHFGETLIGVSTIRAFGVETRFMEEVLTKLDNNNAPYYFLWMCNRWLSIRVDFMGAMVNFIAGILILLNIERVEAGWAGISLVSTLNIMGLIYWLVRIYTEMEMSLNSVERVQEYLHMPQEPPAILPGSRPPAGWPYDGTIEIKDLTMQYAPDLKPALEGISIRVRPREKIGIVGRTGSGKSTLALSLFRFMEPTAGSIVIDGIDICKIGVEDLRRSLTIIPQDAVLFNGTIRSNLDPFQEHDDLEIWESLRRVHLVKARGSRSGSASSMSSSPYGDQHPDQPNFHRHPHAHHESSPYDMNGSGPLFNLDPIPSGLDSLMLDASASEYQNGVYNDPFHPAVCPQPMPTASAVLSPVSRYETMDPATQTVASTPLLYGHNNGLLPVDPMSPRVLCSAFNQGETAEPAPAQQTSSPQPQSDQVDPFESLDSPVSDGGHNFSQGQRQLLCMARALLRQSKVIIMDEATASVDFATDERIQTTIRNELGDSTLITVAHRLRTIMDYDRVLVLEEGRVIEFDSPINLITNPSSRFRDMVEKSGECDTLFEMAARCY